jgi:hypothetical protein
VEWLVVGVVVLVVIGAAWIVFGAMGFRRNMRSRK